MYAIAAVSAMSAPLSISLGLRVPELYMVYSGVLAVLLAIILLCAVRSRNPRHANLAYGMGLIYCVCVLTSAFFLGVTNNIGPSIFASLAFLAFAYISYMIWSFQFHLKGLQGAARQQEEASSLQHQGDDAAAITVEYQPPPLPHAAADSSTEAGGVVVVNNDYGQPPPAYHGVPPQ